MSGETVSYVFCTCICIFIKNNLEHENLINNRPVQCIISFNNFASRHSDNGSDNGSDSDNDSNCLARLTQYKALNIIFWNSLLKKIELKD